MLSKEGHARCRSCGPSGGGSPCGAARRASNEVQRSYAAFPNQVGTAVPDAPSARRDTMVAANPIEKIANPSHLGNCRKQHPKTTQLLVFHPEFAILKAGRLIWIRRPHVNTAAALP